MNWPVAFVLAKRLMMEVFSHTWRLEVQFSSKRGKLWTPPLKVAVVFPEDGLIPLRMAAFTVIVAEGFGPVSLFTKLVVSLQLPESNVRASDIKAQGEVAEVFEEAR